MRREVPLVTVWLDSDDNLFLASSGGNAAVPGAHGEDNVIYTSKNAGYGAITGGLTGGRLVS